MELAALPPLIGAALIGGLEALGAGGAAIALGTEVTVAGVGIGTGATLLGSALLSVGSVGAQFAFSRAAAKRGKKQGDLQITSITIKQPVPVRSRAVGRVRISGALFYEDAFPVIYQPLIMGLVHCEGPIHKFLGIYLNDSLSGVLGGPDADASGINASLPWAFYITIESKRGTNSQAASSILSTQRGLTDWNLNGLAYTVIMCSQPYRPDKYLQYYFPNGVPTVSALMETSLIYDPRDGSQDWADETTWKYSANSALAILHLLTYYKTDAGGRKVPRGMGIPQSKINTASFAAFATMCDETYQSKYSTNPFDGSVVATPRNEHRYECHGVYNLDEPPAEVLNRMLATCDGTLYTDNNGKVCIRGGAWEAPTVLINDDMILSCHLSKSSGQYEAFNRLKISFTAENMLYNVVEGHPWDDEDDIADNGVLAEDLPLPYCLSYSQARRLAKIAIAKGNPEWVYSSLTCTFAALNVLGEEYVHVTHSMPGIDGPFLVHNVKIDPDAKTVELNLTSIDPTCYDWDAETEDAVPPSPQGGTG